MNQTTPMGPAIRSALTALAVLIFFHISNALVFQWPLVALYPIQLAAYYIAGRTAGGNAADADTVWSGQGVHRAGVGGLTGFFLSILMWIFFGLMALFLEIVNLGGFVAGFFGWLLCFAMDLPIAIGFGAAGGRSGEPRY